MKICAIICEYNPFHNGHLYHLGAAKQSTGADFVVCIMSGNFVQRGEAAAMGKYARARHAVLAGADAVIELPVVFSTSSAEFFAQGAVKLSAAIPEVEALCFGAENGNEKDFFRAAELLESEPAKVSDDIRRRMKEGESYIKARAGAWAEATGLEPADSRERTFPLSLLTAPNNILGVEYARAIRSRQKTIRLFPIRRIGSGYSDETLRADYPSATALRAALERGEKLSDGVPEYVRGDLPLTLENDLEALEKLALLQRSAEDIKSVLDCSEGLENALKRAAEENVKDIARALTSKRYTTSRLRRVLLQNLLGISEAFIRECFASPLYLRLLAVRKGREDVLSALGRSAYPLLSRSGDEQRLEGTARACAEKERFADEVFRIVRNLPPEVKNVAVE